MEAAQYGFYQGEPITDEITLRKHELFDMYVRPYLRMIYKLCIKYTFDSRNIQENYTDVLANLYRYIETYDKDRSIKTWLHIVTKRCVFDLDERRKKQDNLWNRDSDIDSFSSYDSSDDFEPESYTAMDMGNYQELYNDDILEALDTLKPQYKRAFLLQQAGYRLKEIAEIEYRNGALDSKNIETVKSRLFLARQQLKKILTRNGAKRAIEEGD